MKGTPQTLLVLDDKHLVTLTQKGDPEAFSPLVSKYQHRLYTHIHGRVKDPETAKDLTQETWLRAYRAIKIFRGESSFSSWLYRIAENVCIDYFRKQKHKHDLDSVPLHAIEQHRLTETVPCPSRDLLRQELRLLLRDAIAHLTPLRRRVFLLYYHHDLPIKAIAHRLSKSEGTIKTHLRNARLHLQEHLTPYLKNQHIPWLL